MFQSHFLSEQHHLHQAADVVEGIEPSKGEPTVLLNQQPSSTAALWDTPNGVR